MKNKVDEGENNILPSRGKVSNQEGIRFGTQKPNPHKASGRSVFLQSNVYNVQKYRRTKLIEEALAAVPLRHPLKLFAAEGDAGYENDRRVKGKYTCRGGLTRHSNKEWV
ncbi:hypothetical protein BDDG_01626 [Blastomyces dermatitidis ATCC 18188]|uniref:Uncharacterized protein n=1 Tax=Ajellomyces dermatitidis (strain ATCC 18188 / CBS 674.68) TaxID=653446 RepID=F2T626_AJEDA|nr:hypothetical protein BDDG_01626 [Blastomyces dermatitidis ATCC 18188]EQL35335.1 hypothetical protein BDFG_02848 [Blastomyces dermatitidis ATCC 26199]